MITDIAGIEVGHWTDPDAQTGCTVVLFPEGTVASGEARGGAPATRDFTLLDPTKMVQRIDAVVLTGGSAFGLASADGVMSFLEESERGFPTAGGVVPIVVAMGLFDLAVGDGSVRPTAANGRAAAESASSERPALGLVGAGTGATTTKWRGPEHRQPGGLVSATVSHRDLVVSALLVANAFGEPGAVSRDVLEGQDGDATVDTAFENTTIGVIATNGALDKVACLQVAQAAHDGLARAVVPAHTAADGDAFVVAATGEVDADVAVARTMAVVAVEDAFAMLDPARDRGPRK